MTTYLVLAVTFLPTNVAVLVIAQGTIDEGQLPQLLLLVLIGFVIHWLQQARHLR